MCSEVLQDLDQHCDIDELLNLPIIPYLMECSTFSYTDAVVPGSTPNDFSNGTESSGYGDIIIPEEEMYIMQCSIDKTESYEQIVNDLTHLEEMKLFRMKNDWRSDTKVLNAVTKFCKDLYLNNVLTFDNPSNENSKIYQTNTDLQKLNNKQISTKKQLFDNILESPNNDKPFFMKGIEEKSLIEKTKSILAQTGSYNRLNEQQKVVDKQEISEQVEDKLIVNQPKRTGKCIYYSITVDLA